MLLRCCDF
uniref:Uncharacterized protein n=1 Tax=Arundo donax TaxID=35708 RepID=A0A0A8Z7C2_ARUDO